MKDTRYSNSKKSSYKVWWSEKVSYLCKTFGCGSSVTLRGLGRART